jgi:hypothetical protein
MPLFSSPDSEEVAALLLAQDILSGCSALQTLFEVGSAAAAEARLLLGPADLPWNGEHYTLEEILPVIAWGQLFPRQEESLLVAQSRAVATTPEKEGVFHLHLRRVVRQNEYIALAGRRDAYLYFLDKTSRIAEQFVIAADESVQNGCLRGHQIKRRRGPFFNPKDDHEQNGIHIWAEFELSWGGSENAE